MGTWNSYSKNYQTCELCYAELVLHENNFLDHEIYDLLLPIIVRKKGEKVDVGFGFLTIIQELEYIISSRNCIDSRDIRHHVNWILKQLITRKERIIDLQKNPQTHMFLRCIWWSRYGDGGPVFSPRQIRELASLNMPCIFQFYAAPNSFNEMKETLENLKHFSGKT